MRFARLFIILFGLLEVAFAQPQVNSLCSDYIKEKKWQVGDTFYWNERFIPDYQSIVKHSKLESLRNLTFKSSFQSTNNREYSESEILLRNKLRLQKDCRVGNQSSLHGCHHFQAYCAMHVSTHTMNKAIDNFANCALRPVRSCGDSFLTGKGIEENLASLEKAFAEILKIKDSISKNQILSDYFRDLFIAYEEIAKLLEEAKLKKEMALKRIAKEKEAQAQAEIELSKTKNKTLEELESQVKDEYSKLYSSDQGFRKACEVLNKCDDYLEDKGYKDEFNIISQSSICKCTPNEKLDKAELGHFSLFMGNLEKLNKEESLKQLSIKSLENSIELTVLEFASTFKATRGYKPSQAEMCIKLSESFCKNPLAIKALRNLDLSNVPILIYKDEIKKFNLVVDEINLLCSKIPRGENIVELESQIQDRLSKVMYETRIGQLMGFDKFRKKVRPFDQKSCFEGQLGLMRIPPNANGEKLLEEAILGILELQKDKSNQINDYLKQVKYTSGYAQAGDPEYEKLLKKLLENDPYTIRKSLLSSNDPDQALWLCRATKDIYKDEKNARVLSWVGTGVCITGSLAATVFTFGGAAPLLVASIAAGTAGGIYNLDKSLTRQHNRSMASAINSADLILNSLQLPELDKEVRAAYVEIALNILPISLKGLTLAGKSAGPILSQSKLIKPFMMESSKISHQLGIHGQKLMKAIKSGGAITEEMIQKALGEKMGKVSSKTLKLLSDLLQGSGPDVTIELIAAAALHPEPLSEEALHSIIQGVAWGVAFNKLGHQGRNLVLRSRHQQISQPEVKAPSPNNPIMVESQIYEKNIEKRKNWEKFKRDIKYEELNARDQQLLLQQIYHLQNTNNGKSLDELERKEDDLYSFYYFLRGINVSSVMAHHHLKVFGGKDAEKFNIKIGSQKNIAQQKALTYPLKIPQKLSNTVKSGNFILFKKEAPHAFKLLEIHQQRRIPSDEHSFDFTNDDYSYRRIMETEFGLCMGQTTAQRKFNMLAFYDKKNSSGQLIPNKKADPEGWSKFYEKQIDLLLNKNQPVIFAGFSNTNELSSDPRLATHIKKRIADLWGDKNISLTGLKIMSSVDNKPDKQKTFKLYKEVEERLSLNFNPILYLAAHKEKKLSSEQWIHVMQVYRLDPINPNGSFRMYVWDVNRYGEKASRTIRVNASGVIRYHDKKLAEVDRVPWDDLEITDMLTNLLEFCNKNPNFCLK